MRGRLSPLWAPLAPLLIFAVVAIVVVATVVAVTDGPGGEAPAPSIASTPEVAGAPLPGGAISVSHAGAPRSLNRVLRNGDTRLVARLMAPVTGENLLTMTPEYRYAPQLATRVPSITGGGVSLDPLTVTFTIRDEAAWSDGTPVTGEDVRFTWRAMTDPGNRISSRAGWEEISEVRVPAPRRVEIVFARPYPEWRELFSASGEGRGALLPAHALEGRDLNTAWNTDPPLGTGPYIVERHEPGAALILARNPNYWNTAAPGPYVDRIVHRFREDGDRAARDFARGRADLLNLGDPSRREELGARAGAAVLAVPGARYEHLLFNTRDPLVGDANVRRAIAHAIDRDALTAGLPGSPSPAQSIVMPEQRDRHVAAWAGYGDEPSEVEALMAASGYAKNAEGFYASGGGELVIEIVFEPDNPARDVYVPRLREQLAAAGFRSSARQIEGLAEVLPSGNFQIAALAADAPPEPDLRARFHTAEIPGVLNGGLGINVARYSDPTLDPVLDASLGEMRPRERNTLFKIVQRTLAEQMVLLPLYQWAEVVGVRRGVGGVTVNPTPVTTFAGAGGWFISEEPPPLASP